MEKYKEIKEKFDNIKSNVDINKDTKTLLYANLMTELENCYNISVFPDLNSEIPECVIQLYKDISNSRLL